MQQDRPSCRTPGISPSMWFADRDDLRGKVAQHLCKTSCPIRRDCGVRAHNSGERFGIFAGFRMDKAAGRRDLAAWLGLPVSARAVAPQQALTCACGREHVPHLTNQITCAACVQGLVEAAPVVAHLAKLHETRTYVAIGTSIGVSPSTLRGIANRRREFVSGEIAELLLAIPVDEAA